MNISEIALPCPNCKSNPIGIIREENFQGNAFLTARKCGHCGYQSPWANTNDEAIRLHNAICRQPTPEAADKLGRWLSAALEDPAVCQEMKADIEAWFATAHPPKPEPTEAASNKTVCDAVSTALHEYHCQYTVDDADPESGLSLYDKLGKEELDLLEDALLGAIDDICLVAAPKPPAEWIEAAAKEIFKQRIYANNNEAFCGPDEIVTIIKQHYSAPAGYQRVPVQPTDTMLLAAEQVPARPDEWDSLCGIYKAMLAAAPKEE